MQRNLLSKFLFFKQVCCLLLLLLSASVTQAQVKLLFDNAVYDGDSVTVDVVAYNFSNIIGMQYTMEFDNELLAFAGFSNFNLQGLTENSFAIRQVENNEERLVLSWIDNNTQGVTVPDGTTLYSLTFFQLSEFAGELRISGDPVAIEVISLTNGEPTLVELNTCDFSLRPANLTGHVYHDLDDNCAFDENESKLSGRIVTIIDANDATRVRYATTNSEGNFGVFVDPAGQYLVTAATASAAWENCSENGEIVSFGADETASVALGQKSIIDCTQMEVSVSTPFVRRCFDVVYTVAYSNLGTITAEDAYVEVTLDEYFSFVSSTTPGTPIEEGSQTYRFELGDVEIGERGRIKITVLVGCEDVELGQSHCVLAHIYPDEPCTTIDPLWSGADIQVTGECTEDDEVRFTITNIGDGNMDEANRFIVSQDMILLQQEDFQLESGQSRIVSLAGDGKTYRLAADQTLANPKAGITAVVVEGCGLNANGEFSTGFVNLFPQSENDPWISIDCQENIGAYDPNDKTPFPKGYGEKRFIENNVELEYKIRFQNTGTDTAFNVVVLDTLSASLNPATVRPGASSHPYDFEITDEGILTFMFDDIMLPDSNVNEPASNGFVIFKVNQTADNVDGTEIYNDAAIYFDFNEPVITNETKHTIGREFVEVVNDVNNVDFPTASVNVYPNPFTEQATFKVEGIDNQEITLRVYNAQGQLIRQQISTQSTFDFYKKGLIEGLYFFEMLIDNKVLNQGKLMLK
ncbi:MAG: T9SS type A sorting domain-containing protein [Saprospiraceae bacterium]